MVDACPVSGLIDDRKTGSAFERNVQYQPGSIHANRFEQVRDILRSPDMRQATMDADAHRQGDPELLSFFFLDGEPHRKRRSAVARFFAPKAIVDRYRQIMTSTMDEIIGQLGKNGSGVLDILSFQMAANVAAEIVGLTESNRKGLTRRLRIALDGSLVQHGNPVRRMIANTVTMLRMFNFYYRDLAPAARARREAPREDVVSYMVAQNYRVKAMIIECMTYATAGMVTTREFISVSAWHLFDNPALRERFLSGDEEDQFAILNEILRLEPVATLLYRRATEDSHTVSGRDVRKDDLFAVDIRAANTDEAMAGPCPFALDPDRAKRQKLAGSWMSFGDGNHRCPGAQVALHETRIFLDRLFRVPGIRLEKSPVVGWNEMIQGYELRQAIVACDKVG